MINSVQARNIVKKTKKPHYIVQEKVKNAIKLSSVNSYKSNLQNQCLNSTLNQTYLPSIEFEAKIENKLSSLENSINSLNVTLMKLNENVNLIFLILNLF